MEDKPSLCSMCQLGINRNKLCPYCGRCRHLCIGAGRCAGQREELKRIVVEEALKMKEEDA